MPIYNHPADIYLTDVEYYELLSPKNIAGRDLLRLARRRGYIFSDKVSNESVRDILTSYPSCWKTVSDVFDRINRPEPDEHQSTVHADGCSDDTDITKIVNAVKASRAEPRGEIYKVHKDKANPGIVRIDVGYTEVDLSRSQVYQRKSKTASIEVSKQGGKISFRFSSNERARSIVSEIESEIKPAKEETIKKQAISLRGVLDAESRTKFFTELVKSIKGYKYINTAHLSVDRRLPDEDGEENAGEEDKAKEDKAKEELKGLVNRVALSGDQVLASSLYQQARKTGYYIFSIRWMCRSTKDAREEVEFEAGFEDAVLAETFKFEVVKRWMTEAKSGDMEVKVLAPSEKRDLLLKLEEAAFEVFEKLNNELKKKNKKKDV